jgi:F-type H+-transporting ATPase subunit b
MTSLGMFVLAQAADTAKAADEESSNFLVSPNVGLMIWTLLAFIVALLILRKYAWPAITEALDKRQSAIEESIDIAERTREDAQQLLEEYRERLREARAQADEIVSRARKAGEVHERETLEKARTQREELLEQTRRDIDAETRRAIQEIRNEVADLTVLATEKVTRKSLTEADQKRLVEDALKELDFSSLSGERQN